MVQRFGPPTGTEIEMALRALPPSEARKPTLAYLFWLRWWAAHDPTRCAVLIREPRGEYARR